MDKMKWLTILSVSVVLSACATEPLSRTPASQRVEDYIGANELSEVSLIRKGNSDSWQYVNDRYVIYRGHDDFLIGFRKNCAEITDNSWVPADYIHDHRNLRAGEDTIRGCIVENIYPLTRDQRNELRGLGGPPLAQ